MPTLNLDVFSKSSWNENEKKKKIIETDSHWTTKESGAIGKERCNIVGGIALTCVCVCVWYALPPLRFPGFTFPHVSLSVFFVFL